MNKKSGRNDSPKLAETTQGRIDSGRNDPGRNDPRPKRLKAETTHGRNDPLPVETSPPSSGQGRFYYDSQNTPSKVLLKKRMKKAYQLTILMRYIGVKVLCKLFSFISLFHNNGEIIFRMQKWQRKKMKFSVQTGPQMHADSF